MDKDLNDDTKTIAPLHAVQLLCPLFVILPKHGRAAEASEVSFIWTGRIIRNGIDCQDAFHIVC
jgi:hypothetical protein